jgi:succinylglutamic semialdehyde dehydrogenase
MTKLWEASGLPQGVFNLIQGDGVLGQALATHSQVKGVLFTGSYTTGQALHRALAGQVSKLLVLEMGGNNPLIVWDEPPLAQTVANILVSAFTTTGQRCTCARRLILPAGQPYSATLLEALMEGAKALTRGEPMAQPQRFMGPLINAPAKNKVLTSIAAWSDLGIQAPLAVETTNDNTGWISPGIYVDSKGHLPDSEVFGPVLVLQYANDFDAALGLANNTAFGLSAGLLSQNAAHWQRFTDISNAGVLAWNKPLTGASSRLPFGGTGHSGNMRPSAWYAADYAAYPVATQSTQTLHFPSNLPEALLPAGILVQDKK